MSLRSRIFVLITVVVSVVLVISLLLVVKIRKNPAAVAPAETTNSLGGSNPVFNGTTATVIPNNVVVKPIDSAASEDNTVRQLAKIFVERFNTYSSDDIYRNIRDVENMVTAEYWKKISLPLTRPINPPATFVALTTKVLAITSSNVLSGQALVVLKAEKSSTSGAATTDSYADFSVSLVKSDGSWLINSQVENK